MRRIDAFAHVLPKPFFDEMRQVHPTEELLAMEDAPRFWDMEIRLQHLDQFGIDEQIINLARPPIWRGVDRVDAIELTRLANDEVARIGEEYPDRFIPVGTLPMVNDTFVEEFERCVNELGMAGVQIFSNVQGEPIDGEAYEPLYERAAAKGVPIWLHPQLHEWHHWDSEYMLHKILGWPFDTSLAMARLVFSGVMERHPNLAVIPHHMGAMIPHFVDRLELFHRMLVEHRDVYPYFVRELETSIEEAFGRFYADTCRGGSSAVLEDGLGFYGEERLVFATDYPFGPERGVGFIRAETRAVEEMDVDEDTRARVFHENLESLLG
jgi:aminocarboxymuconate-semialdehyde decarboxylase